MDIGIDLGTTFSVIAVPGRVQLASGYPEGVYFEGGDVTIIPTPEGDELFPSVLGLNPEAPGEYVVGMAAKQAAEDGAAPIMWAKRKIGTTEPLRLGDKVLTAKDVAREVLKYLKLCAVRALGRPVERAVVTHPAYFERPQVEETRQAAQEAGFDMSLPEQTLMEPVAAALAYTRCDTTDPLRFMVYDLGGGTFDVTILERRGGVISCKAFDGDHLLGGSNFDRKLVQWLLDRLRSKGRELPYDESNPDHRGQRARLLTYMEDLKTRLAGSRSKRVALEVKVSFLVDAQGRKVQAVERITQEEFVQLIQPELDKTIECCESCLRKAGMTAEDLNYVLLVGGSTHGPWVRELVEAKYGGGEKVKQFRPDECVAAGAAIHSTTLPTVARGDKVKAVLEVPQRHILPTLNVAGHLEVSEESLAFGVSSSELPNAKRGTRNAKQSASDAAFLKGMSVVLRAPDRALGPEPVGEGGVFLFPDVALLEDGPTQFALQVIDAHGTAHLDHPFTVEYAPGGDVSVPVVPVLPKSLYVETTRGMKALAKEGCTLPSDEIEVPLKRNFSESTLEIKIYQSDVVAAVIQVTDIPEQAGEGSKVLLKVRVTDKSEIKGRVQVLTPRGQVARDWPVSVTFKPAPIPDVAELEAAFGKLENERLDKLALADDPERRTLLAGRGELLADDLRRRLAEVPPDRQEVARAVREFEKLVNPPEDDMSPPKSQFDQLLMACRELISEQKDNPQVQTYAKAVDRNEKEGEDAYQKHDEKRWAGVCSNLSGIYQRLMPKPPDEGKRSREPEELPPTPILKDQATFAISQARASLDSVREAWANRDPAKYQAKIRARCDRVDAQLNAMDTQVEKIKDDADPRAARGQLQLALRTLKEAEDTLRKIEHDVEVT